MKNLLLFSFMTTLYACGIVSTAPSSQLINKISTGMSKSQVISILGNPISTSVAVEAESVICMDYDLIEPNSNHGESGYHVILQDEKVRFYGKSDCSYTMKSAEFNRLLKK